MNESPARVVLLTGLKGRPRKASAEQDCLTERERGFIRDLPNWTSGGPTWNQFKWLVKIFERLTDPDENVYSRRLRQAIGGK